MLDTDNSTTRSGGYLALLIVIGVLSCSQSTPVTETSVPPRDGDAWHADADGADGHSNLPGDSDLPDDRSGDTLDTLPADTDSPGAWTFSVLTINLLHDFPTLADIDERTDMVANAINLLQPDLVALQEVSASGLHTSRAEVLADSTGYVAYWEPVNDYGAVFQEGPGILSKWPIVWAETYELPHAEASGFGKRGVAVARVQTPHGSIVAISTHLTDETPEKQADQAVAVYETILNLPLPVSGVLAGDMNADPQSLTSMFFRGEAEYNGAQANYIDAWVDANGAAPGLTHPSDAPEHRIDYVYWLFSSEMSGQTTGCDIVLDEAVAGLYASNHLGLFCTVHVTPNP